MAVKRLPRASKEELMKRHDFNYVREHFFDSDCTKDDLVKDILEVYNDNLDLHELSAEGKNTVRVTNYFVRITQSKATSIRAKMSPYQAIQSDEALCEIFNRIDNHPKFFSIRKDTELKLQQEGYTPELMSLDVSTLSEPKASAVKFMQDYYREQINLADLREVRRAMAHMPAYHRVSQFPNHVAQRIYERYAPIHEGVILDSSSGWGNRMMAALCSKYHYKYLGTDPNSEMHPNYLALAELICSTLYKTNPLTQDKKFPDDFIDIKDQGSEYDVPEWHNWSGYTEEQKQEILNRTSAGPCGGRVYEAHGKTHPIPGTLRGCCDTGKYLTVGLQLPPIFDTHNPEVFNSGIGDLSFTSPPYFALECYTEDSFKGDLSTGQSAGKGDNYLRWVKEFMYPTVINHFNYLKPGGYYIYNLKDLPNDHMSLYSDWLSVCLDVGFELIEQPEMILKARRQFGKAKINFNGATERVAVLRKPLNPDDVTITNSNLGALYHIQHNFNYPIIQHCRPKEFTPKLPKQVEDYLAKKFEGKRHVLMKKS